MNISPMRIVGESIKISVGIFAVTWIEPSVEAMFSWAPEAFHYLVAAIIAATLIVVLSHLFIGMPRINIEWRDERENTPINALVARHKKRTNLSQKFDLSIQPAATSVAANWVARRLLLKYQPRLAITFGTAPEQIDIIYYEPSSEQRIEPHEDGAGMYVNANIPLPREGNWIWGQVTWELTGNISGETRFQLSHRFEHPSRTGERLLNTIVRVNTNAKTFHIERI